MNTRAACLLALITLTCGDSAAAQPARDVAYNSRSVIRIDARLRMTTLVILPEAEEILDYVCGDKDYWIISGAQNLAYVKPAKAGASTNLNLVTASGHIYSFLLVEGSTNPDLKVFVTPNPGATPATHALGRRDAALEVEGLKGDLADARAEAERAKADAEDAKRTSVRQTQEAIDRFKASYPTQLHFPYVFKARSKPFRVTAIYHDGRFTYIHTDGREFPALYEVIDFVPNLVPYQVERNIYIVPKVIEHGYLAIGKRRLPFDVAER